MVLVFARKDLAETTLPDLHDRITNSENKVTTTTGIIVACLFFVVISFVSIIIVNITSPIENIRKISGTLKIKNNQPYSKILILFMFFCFFSL